MKMKALKNQIPWLPLVDMFRTFYFDEITDLKDELETLKANFIFTQ